MGLRKPIHGSGRRIGVECRLDPLERRSQWFALSPTCVVQAVANRMHEAGLQRCGWKCCAQRIGDALEAIRYCDQAISPTAGFEVVKDLHPELRLLGVLGPETKHVPRASMQHPESQVDGLVAHHRFFADLHPPGRYKTPPGTLAPVAASARQSLHPSPPR